MCCRLDDQLELATKGFLGQEVELIVGTEGRTAGQHGRSSLVQGSLFLTLYYTFDIIAGSAILKLC